jgi:hypothetical protein
MPNLLYKTKKIDVYLGTSHHNLGCEGMYFFRSGHQQSINYKELNKIKSKSLKTDNF